MLARVTGLAWTGPALATPGLGWRFRLGLAVLLAAVLLPVVEPMARPPEGPAAVARACVVEVLVGAALGWSAALVVAGARQAGEIIGLQAGLSPAALLDPEAGDELTPLGHLYALIALAVFLRARRPARAGQGLGRELSRAPGRRGRPVRRDGPAGVRPGRAGARARRAARGADGAGPGAGGGGAWGCSGVPPRRSRSSRFPCRSGGARTGPGLSRADRTGRVCSRPCGAEAFTLAHDGFRGGDDLAPSFSLPPCGGGPGWGVGLADAPLVTEGGSTDPPP